jgi:hypothetical protein
MELEFILTIIIRPVNEKTLNICIVAQASKWFIDIPRTSKRETSEIIIGTEDIPV